MRLSILFVTLLIVGSVAGIVAPAQLNGVGSVRAADIREINLDGLKKILQRDPKDTRPLLINFWATWCDPCREEFPDLVKIDADYTAARLNFVAVSLDEVADIKTAVPKFLKEMKAAMPVVLLNVNDPEPAIKVSYRRRFSMTRTGTSSSGISAASSPMNCGPRSTKQ